jgi:hypothetical protein
MTTCINSEKECGDVTYTCKDTMECPKDTDRTRGVSHDFELQAGDWFKLTRSLKITGYMSLKQSAQATYHYDWGQKSGGCCTPKEFDASGTFHDQAEVTLKRLIFEGPITQGSAKRCTITDTLHGVMDIPGVDAGTATFKEFMGNGVYHKFHVIGGKWTTTQTIKLKVDGGQEQVLYTKSHTIDAPPPKSQAGEDATWIYRTGGQTTLPISKDFKPINGLQEIIVYPNPPSLGIPNDDDLRFYGFYDYGNMPGLESGLAIKDGGKDYWYPEWMRRCPFPIPALPSTAQARYDATWNHFSCNGKMIYAGGAEYLEHHPVSAVSYDSTTLASGSLNTQNLYGGAAQFLASYDSTGLVLTNAQGMTLHPLSFL